MRTLYIPEYSYNNIIIIVTKAFISEFLSARFVHPGAPQPTIPSFLTELEHKNKES